MAMYWHDISMLDYGLAGALVILFLYQVYFYARYIAGVNRWRRRNAKPLEVKDEQLPGVSVIVAARNEEQNLTTFLPALLGQDYPNYEVIVVNDGSEDNTEAVLSDYTHKYSHLHITFVPVEARVTSSKKLALTLAVKAAHNEFLLFTDADCVPESNQWIREMIAPMIGDNAEQRKVVLGYSPYFSDDNAVNQIIRYDTLFCGLQYLGMAYSGHPYMGVGRNLLYRKSMFMERNGFYGLLAFRSGDDDLFVNRVATKQNTVIVASSNSLSWSLPKTTFAEWVVQKRRHLSVSPFYKPATRRRLGLEPLTRGLWYLTVVLCFVLGSAWTMALAWLLLVIRLFIQMGIINKAARRFGEKTYGLEVMWYDILLPVFTAFLLSTQPKNSTRCW
ncbi:MAG: glycosyltransferase [Paludibacteraceae bacterium]|nr:glycosyltransferase [Paludibacteraceae bacterium]